MKTIRFFSTATLIICMVWLLGSGCHKDVKCPNGDICVQGTTILYQKADTDMILKLVIPPNAVAANAQLFFDDLTYTGSFGTNSMWFGKSYFDIKPYNIQLLQLIRIELGYLPGHVIDDLGNNYEDDLKLYSVQNTDSGDQWSIVNGSTVDKANHVVYADVIKFGRYAVAAPKSMLVDEWLNGPAIGPYNYQRRMILYRDGTGIKYDVVDCDTSANFDWELATRHFRWEILQDSILKCYSFQAQILCNGSGPVTPDINQVFHVSDTYLNYDYTWTRH